MPGNYQRHLEEYGTCSNPEHSGVEMMALESQDDYTGRWRTEEVPACAVCFGLL